MSECRTNVVEASRLEWPTSENGKRAGPGDIHASYSGDTIAFRNTVRKPFLWRGEQWVAVSLTGIGGIQQAEAFRLVAVEWFQGATTTYTDRCAYERAARAARRDPMGFYHGIRVKRGGATYVLSGPEERFVAGTPSLFEGAPPSFAPIEVNTF